MKIFDIAIMGTSLTAGAGRAYSYVRDLIPKLEEGKHSRVRVYNFGKDGARSDQGVTDYPQVAALRPKAVLIEYQMNDCTVAYATSQARTISIIDGIRAASPGTLVFLMTMNPTYAGASDVSSRALLPSFYQMYRDLAASKGTGLIDCYPSWAPATLADVPDGMHPLQAAHRLYTIPSIVAALSPSIE